MADLVRTIVENTADIDSLAISPDGATLAVGRDRRRSPALGRRDRCLSFDTEAGSSHPSRCLRSRPMGRRSRSVHWEARSRSGTSNGIAGHPWPI